MNDGSDGSDNRQSFAEPDDVLEQEDLTYDQKLDILQRWRSDLKDASGRDNRERLQRVDQAIERLQVDVTLDPDKPRSAPSGRGYRPKS